MFAKKKWKEKNKRYATAYFEACMHMAAELNGGVNLACLKTRIMMINVTAWKLITIVSQRFPIMPQTLLWKLIWIFHKSKRQSCSKAIWHVPSPVYISSGLAEELKNNHARCLLASRKRASPVAILFLFFFFCHITFKWKHFGASGMPNFVSRCCVCKYAVSTLSFTTLPDLFITAVCSGTRQKKCPCLKITRTGQADELTTNKWV